jgi:hypothetical protein
MLRNNTRFPEGHQSPDFDLPGDRGQKALWFEPDISHSGSCRNSHMGMLLHPEEKGGEKRQRSLIT